jgi:unsaturated rhamnogalacturonyl hydrolase
MIGSAAVPADVEQRVLLALLAMQRLPWEQGVAAHAAADLDRKDLLWLLAHEAVLRRAPAGPLANVEDVGIVDGAAAGEAVLWLAEQTGADEDRAALAGQLDWILRTAPRAGDGTIFHVTGTEQVWVDSVYMVVPLLMATGHAAAAMAQLDGHRRRLHDDATGLWSHIWDEPSGRLERAAHWGSGNGWVAAGLARALRADAATPRRDALVAQARAVIEACLRWRRDDGLFHDVVDDPSTFVETNLAQMLAYSILTGVADGWLEHSWFEIGRDLRRAGAAKVDEHGLVRGACGAPSFDHSGTSAEAQAFFLMAAAAERRAARQV